MINIQNEVSVAKTIVPKLISFQIFKLDMSLSIINISNSIESTGNVCAKDERENTQY